MGLFKILCKHFYKCLYFLLFIFIYLFSFIYSHLQSLYFILNMCTSYSICDHSNMWSHYRSNHAEYCFCWLWCMVACSCMCFVISNCELMFNWGTLWDPGLRCFPSERICVYFCLASGGTKVQDLVQCFPQQKFCTELPAWQTLYYLYPPFKDAEMEIKRDYVIWEKSHRMSRQSWVWTQEALVPMPMLSTILL